MPGEKEGAAFEEIRGFCEYQAGLLKMLKMFHEKCGGNLPPSIAAA
jgi:hypothetical protein